MDEHDEHGGPEGQEDAEVAPENRLPVQRNRGAGDLNPLPDDLEPEVREFALQLRALFGLLHISLGQYAALHNRSKGGISRYLSGNRIPDRSFLDELLRELAPTTAEVRAHLYDLHLSALHAQDRHAYHIQLITNQLADAAVELKQTTNQVRNLQQTLSAREQEIQELSTKIGDIEQAWAADRNHSEEELSRYRDQHIALESQRDNLAGKIADLQAQLQWADSRREAAEARCKILEQALEASEESPQEGNQFEISGDTFPVIWGNVPLRNSNFTGRDEILDFISGARTKAGRGYSRKALVGMPGVGKTQIAAEYAHRFKSRYDLIYWIPADQLPSVRAGIAALGQNLRLESGPSTGIDGLIQATLDCLRRGAPYQRWLIIFDNANSIEELREYLVDGAGDVLITSRNQSWGGVADITFVDVFSRHESLGFLEKSLLGSSEKSVANRLAETLGDLPLALEQAAELISQSGTSPNSYIELLRRQPTELFAQAGSWSYPRSFAATCKLAFDDLKRRNPDSLLLLRCLALSDLNPTPLSIFTARDGMLGTQLSQIVVSPIVFGNAMGNLIRSSLVRIDHRSKTVWLHPLVRALICDELDNKETDDIKRNLEFLISGETEGVAHHKSLES